MNIETLEKILKCPNLPSLPTVAVKVIDLSANPSVRMDELAKTIQNDQGLSAKILRTVNSSFYGLRKPCSTIHAAIVMLGLGPVKTLALGFSLVSAVGRGGDEFDYTAYWRRGLYTAVGARVFAESARMKQADEAFLGGLLQDIGMMAMFRGLGDDYLAVMSETGGDHRRLVQAELAAFEVQHPDVGSMLAERWKLPRELVLPVKYHERPTAAPMECGELIRAVAIGNLVHDALSDTDPTPALRKLYDRAAQWLNLDAGEVDQALLRANLGIKELTSVFTLATGPLADAEDIVRRARSQSDQVIRSATGGSEGLDSLLIDSAECDPLTGLPSRLGFDRIMRNVHAATSESSLGMCVMYMVVDQVKQHAVAFGQHDCDRVLTEVALTLKKHFGQVGGFACRPTADVFAVVLPRMNSEMAVAVCEGFRDEIGRLHLPPDGAGNCSQVNVSVGIAASNGEEALAADLVRGAVTALQAARTAGGNCLRTLSTRRAA